VVGADLFVKVCGSTDAPKGFFVLAKGVSGLGWRFGTGEACRAANKKRVATVSVFLTVGFSHARYPNGNRT
jgi:hypothetical protein